MIFILVCLVAIVAALVYMIAMSSAVPVGAKWAELARITFAAAIFAIMFALALGTHDAIIRVTR